MVDGAEAQAKRQLLGLVTDIAGGLHQAARRIGTAASWPSV